MRDEVRAVDAKHSLSLDLEDLEIEELTPVEIDEDVRAHPENIASSTWTNTTLSSMVMFK